MNSRMRKRSQPRHGEGADRGCGERGGPEETHRLGGFDEHFALPELELVTVHVDGLQQVEDTLFLVPSPRRPGGFGQNGVPVRTMRERKIRLSLDHPPKALGAARVLAIPSPPFQGSGMDLNNCKNPLGPDCPFQSCLLTPSLSDHFHAKALEKICFSFLPLSKNSIPEGHQ